MATLVKHLALSPQTLQLSKPLAEMVRAVHLNKEKEIVFEEVRADDYVYKDYDDVRIVEPGNTEKTLTPALSGQRAVLITALITKCLKNVASSPLSVGKLRSTLVRLVLCIYFDVDESRRDG